MSSLLILAHHNFNNSIYNKKILESIKNVSNLDIKILDGSVLESFYVDVQKEQELLKRYNNIIVQFPFSWYNMPAVLKNYIDTVFTRGFAHGVDGDKLKGKNLLMCITCGGNDYTYSEGGYNRYNFSEFLKPMNLIFTVAQMIVKEPLVVFGCKPTSEESLISLDFDAFIDKYKKAINSL